ncbi:tetratricopeptide repeat protein [Brachyspira pilosicoli]|uniref:tetratricopeptide repeat protein n=1 Tax=Brachyspira pilosicoli TaxID=52584 RepID=UPI00300481E7
MTEELKNKILNLIEEKHIEEAINLCDESIEKDDKDEDAYFYIGICKFDLKNYKESIKYFDKVIEINPSNENAYFNIALSKSNLKQYEEAIKYYDEFLKLNTNDKYVYINIGVLKANLGRYEESIKDFYKVIEICPDSADAYFNIGVSKAYSKMYDESIIYFDKAIKINLYYEDAYFNRGISRIYLKRYEESIKDFNYVAKINSNFKNDFIIDIMNSLEMYPDIEKIFQLLIKNENIILWRNEPITNLISRFKESKNFNNELKENIKYLLLYEYFLLKILTFDIEENNNIEISHYTSLDVLPLLLNVKENTKESGNIRINNITTANDPKEGKILESIFNKNNIDIKIENDEKALTLQTSYSRNKDSLTMFRLYGKKENKEATGICLVLNNEYFDNLYTSPYSYEFKFKIENNKIEIDEKINKEKSQENKRNLYWVLYYNEKENQLIYNKEKSKYASNIIDLNDLVDNIELKEDDKKEDLIKYAFAKIFYYTKEIKKEVDKNYQNIKNQLYSYLFENIKYIIKHEAFFEEQELRMLVTNDYKSDEILIDNDKKKLYIDYIKLFDERNNYIKEIIIGSKVENNEAVAEYIRKVLHTKNTEMNKLDDIKVSISEAPLR